MGGGGMKRKLYLDWIPCLGAFKSKNPQAKAVKI